MIHPSYFELMDIVNQNVAEGEAPVITSRYSIVLGTAKRARQLVAANRSTYRGQEEKPLSIAVDELKNGEIHIIRNEDVPKELPEEEAAAEEIWAGEDLPEEEALEKDVPEEADEN